VEHVQWARDLAERLLAEPLPRRWAHTQGVGRKAESIAHIVGDDADLLICAAWLHDIGYAPNLVSTGFHPLDGARYLRDDQQSGTPLCRLIANHSGANVEARHRGLAADLRAGFPPIDGLVADALTYADMTTSPDGFPVTLDERIKEIHSRYPSHSVVTISIAESANDLERTIQIVLSALNKSH